MKEALFTSTGIKSKSSVFFIQLPVMSNQLTLGDTCKNVNIYFLIQYRDLAIVVLYVPISLFTLAINEYQCNFSLGSNKI